MTTKDTAMEDSVKLCYSSWSKDYYANYYGPQAPYPAVHSNLIKKLLTHNAVKLVLDAGCGPASMLRDLDDLGMERFGFDLTPEMVNEAQAVLAAQGVHHDCLWQGNVLEQAAYQPPGTQTPIAFDAVLCIGVLPHIPQNKDRLVIDHLVQAVKPGGLVIMEARNQLFSLFTLNRYSKVFFRDILINEKQLRQCADDEIEPLELALTELDQLFRTDLPPQRTGDTQNPGYDEILSRTHNPLELRQLAEQAGLHDVEVLFYHYHALPPMLQHRVPNLFRTASIAMENPHDWRGHFMASAFLIAGKT